MGILSNTVLSLVIGVLLLTNIEYVMDAMATDSGSSGGLAKGSGSDDNDNDDDKEDEGGKSKDLDDSNSGSGSGSNDGDGDDNASGGTGDLGSSGSNDGDGDNGDGADAGDLSDSVGSADSVVDKFNLNAEKIADELSMLTNFQLSQYPITELSPDDIRDALSYLTPPNLAQVLLNIPEQDLVETRNMVSHNDFNLILNRLSEADKSQVESRLL